MTRRELLCLLGSSAPAAAWARGRDAGRDLRLKGGFRKAEQKGWIYVHLEGSPAEIGFQHGSLLSAEIADTHKAIALSLTHDAKPYSFYRDAMEKLFWPHVDEEYKQELQGMAEGLKSRGVTLDVWDLVVANASLELPYYTSALDKVKKPVAERCSAFVATGSYTKDGHIVIGHNCWSDYLSGSRWNIIFDIHPSRGERFIMDGLPGLIHSGDDYGVNGAGLVITETTISQFSGFDTNGIPEFVRARKAMQYARSVDEFASIMKEGNNGGYANTWLVADTNTNEIASLELGLRNVTLERTSDGYFVGSNFPKNAKLIQEETDYNPNDPTISGNARRARWETLMSENKGRIDVSAGHRFLADHYDPYSKQLDPGERTLCGHVDLSRRGLKPWSPPFGPFGAVQNKVADSAMAKNMSFTAHFGHACGLKFKADDYFRKHTDFMWQKGTLKDIPAPGWTLVKAS
jgi:hypothetical protein